MHELRRVSVITWAIALSLPAQLTWVRKPHPQLLEAAVTYDPTTQRVLAYDGTTWSWTRDGWVQTTGSVGPRQRAAMAYDRVSQGVILFGGDGSNHVSLWRGGQWSSVIPNLGLAPRSEHTLVWDVTRGRTYLFGGQGQTTFGDFWEWDGANWINRSTSGPSARAGHVMAFDAARGVSVMFGGRNAASSLLGETWTWDGVRWTSHSPSVAPSPRQRAVLAYDRNRRCVVLFGGSTAQGYVNETWEWDGTLWTERRPARSPDAAQAIGAVFDPVVGRVVLVARRGGVWHWDGVAWEEAAPPTPPSGFGPMVADTLRRRLVMFANPLFLTPGMASTWEWFDDVWVERRPARQPAPREFPALAFDAGRGRTVLFGGGYQQRNDTWEWDGNDWHDVTLPNGPSPRYWSTMVFDAARARTVLFGGSGSGAFVLADHWEWDGTLWTQRSLAVAPSARRAHAMAYDRARQRVVLYGGQGSGGVLQPLLDTWEWDGSAWSLRAAGGPLWGQAHMAFDEARQRVVLAGVQNGGTATDTWEWDGRAWTPFIPIGVIPYLRNGSLACESWRDRLVFAAGDTWVLSRHPADASGVGPGCPVAGRELRLSPNTRPQLGVRGFALDVYTNPSAALAIVVSTGSVNLRLYPGCNLLVDANRVIACPTLLSSGAGFATVPLPLPPTSDLNGVVLFAQAGVLAASAPIGFALSAQVVLRLGD